MMNIDQPIGTRFRLDDGRIVYLMAHEWDGRVRLAVEWWPASWPTSPTTRRGRQTSIYMTPRAFSRRAKLYTTAQADTEGGDRKPGDIHN